MKIVIKTKNLELNQSLRDFIEEKINSLEKFSKIFQNKGKYSNHLPERSERWRRADALRLFGKPRSRINSLRGRGKPRIEAWVEIGKTTSHHQKGPFFWTECQMRFPGQSLRATSQAQDLRLAIGEVKDELQRELKRYKEKLMAQRERKARVLKKELHFSPQARFWRKGRIRQEGI